MKKLPVIVLRGFLNARKSTRLSQDAAKRDELPVVEFVDESNEGSFDAAIDGGPMSAAPFLATPAASLSSTGTAWKDWIGVVASIGCAIHCAAMPFVIAFLPALGLSFLADEAFHKWMALACFVIALAAFVPGWRKHRRLTPAIIAVVGITVITSAAFGMTGDCCAACDATTASAAVTTTDPTVTCTDVCCELCSADAAEQDTLLAATPSTANLLAIPAWLSPWVTPIGGLLLVCGHLLNRRYGCLCGCCDSTAATE